MDEHKEEYFIYLDGLRESGVTNMYGAGAYLEATFPIDPNEARDVLMDWMATFESRHPQ